MSQESNTNLLELAAEHLDYWAGEGIGAVLEADLARDDLDSLSMHLRESAKLMFDLEYRPLEATDVF